MFVGLKRDNQFKTDSIEKSLQENMSRCNSFVWFHECHVMLDVSIIIADEYPTLPGVSHQTVCGPDNIFMSIIFTNAFRSLSRRKSLLGVNPSVALTSMCL